MALPILTSTQYCSFTRMLLPLQKKSSSLAIWSSNVLCPTQCRASYDEASSNSSRRSAKFQPSIWTYDYIQSLSSDYKEERYAEQHRVLREEVRVMLCRVENQLELIDVLQRLGVAHHFHNEIRNILDNVYNTDTSKWKKNLYATALEFRLLRQHGYDISTDVFVCIQDETDNFKKCESVDVEGMLQLYEASFHSFEDETILDEARDFTTKFLKEYLNQNRDDHISLLISHSFELPLHWRIPRWETQWFINVYERQQNMSPALLQFAKLDFNILQTIYQEELKYISRWWKRIGLREKLSFSRDRLVEDFAWTVGMNFKPDFEYFRNVMTKVIAIVVIIDDIYDAYGTLEELELFTEAIDRWDLKAIDGLPDYMKICFYALFNFVNEMAFETLKNNGCNITPYLKKAWAGICKSYFTEAKWYHGGYTPSFEEYIENGCISISTSLLLTYSYFLSPQFFKKEDLDHLEENSSLIRFSAMIFRLSNDLGTYKRENETGDIPTSIQCYMKETGASEEEAHEYVKSMMCTAWKKVNKEAHNSCCSQNFADMAINITRVALYMYQYGDGFTIQDLESKDHIISLLFQPIPVKCTQK